MRRCVHDGQPVQRLTGPPSWLYPDGLAWEHAGCSRHRAYLDENCTVQDMAWRVAVPTAETVEDDPQGGLL